jgi:hypothetical protein
MVTVQDPGEIIAAHMLQSGALPAPYRRRGRFAEAPRADFLPLIMSVRILLPAGRLLDLLIVTLLVAGEATPLQEYL